MDTDPFPPPPPPPPPLPPRLPLAPIEETLASYLDNLKSLLSAEEWAEMAAEVEAFRAEHGDRLQARLEDRRNELDQWAYQWWLEDMYLKVSLEMKQWANRWR